MSLLKNEIKKLGVKTLLTNKEISKIAGCSVRTVNKYAGSYTSRCKAKVTSNSEEMFLVKKSVLLPDIHHPNYDQKVMDTIEEFIIDYEPDELVYMGDQITLDSISAWNKNKPLLKEGRRLLKEYDRFNEDILISHENITNPDIKRVFFIGNHEKRVDWYVEKFPELQGFVEIQNHLKLKERGYEVIPFNGVYKIGHLNVIHGYYWNKYHSVKTIEAFEESVVYSHVHNPQMYAKVSPIDGKGYHTATALGCICNINPDYKQGIPNFWLNGFGIVESLPATGQFTLYTPIIVDGGFMFNGRYYGKDL